jgi:UDP-N-acetylmuramoyl-tripeptide--D-alanyl-D-alanine ligase
MATITTEDIVRATGGELLSENAKYFKGVSIDSRTISDGEIYFAIRGRNFDGHDFVRDALKKGSGAVIDSKQRPLSDGKVIIHVKDTLRALQDLAYSMREKRNIPVIAITGSNGKTTTKEMTYSILSEKFKVLKNEGNLNNHIGLPLSLSRITPDDQVIVLELGMNSAGEIKRLCEISSPSHGVITNIGSAHIGELGDVEAVRAAKLEILNGLSVIVLNADDGFLMEGYNSAAEKMESPGRAITFSIHNESDVRAENVLEDDQGVRFTLKLKDGGSVEIFLPVHGLFNVYNALAASAVCVSLGMTAGEIKTALHGYTAFPMRFDVFREGEVTFIDDSYNANPSSMEAALEELARFKGGKRAVAVLGDMFELGKYSENSHRDVGRTITKLGIEIFVAVGGKMSLAAEECRKISPREALKGFKVEVYDFGTSEEAARSIRDIVKDRDVVLIKGSRAMRMEKIMEAIRD